MLQSDLKIILNSLNVHRLLITAVLIAGKFQDDCYFNNVHYAKVGGISHEEINQLEQEFLEKIQYRLNILPVDFKRFRWLMENVMIMQQNGHESMITKTPFEIDCLLRLYELFPK